MGVSSTQLQTWRFNIFNNFMTRQTPDLAAFSLRMYFALAVQSAAGADIASTGEYIQQLVMNTFKSFGDAFELQETIGNFMGTLENVSDLMYTLEDLSEKQTNRQGKGSNTRLTRSTDESITFTSVDIVAPGGTCCANDLTFKVEKGKPLIVTGPNASGKSSLFRMLGGLWKVPADQITYPKKIQTKNRTQEDEKELFGQLEMVQIEYLVDRYAKKNDEGEVLVSGWDAVMKWEDVLSLGEQQRIGCARLFYTNPTFAILDECTSAVSIDVEEKLYRQAHAQNITSITISQRLALEEFHTQELKLGDSNGPKGWSLRQI